MSRLTLCLIARDEEAMLPGCLASVRGAVDEIVLVDTGSGDRTVELARAAGAIVLRRPWDDDFAAPRNLAAERASGDYLLALDADERLAPGAGSALRAAVDRADFDLGLLRVHNATRRDAAPAEVLGGAARIAAPVLLARVVRRRDGVAWRGAIHESVEDWFLRIGGRARALDVDVVHYGYDPSIRAARDKRARNLALLRRRCALEPEDVTAFGYLALELLEAGDEAGAQEVVDSGWTLLGRQPPWRSAHRLASARAILALRRGDGEAVLETSRRIEERAGGHPDLDFLRGCGEELLAVRASPGSAERRERLARAIAALGSARRRLATEGPFLYPGAVSEVACQLHLGVVHLLAGDVPESLRAFGAAVAAEPASPSARVGLAEALVEAGEPARALALLEPILGAAPDGWLVAAAATARLGAWEDARLFLSRAAERRARGYECLHRFARHDALARELAAPAGEPPGPGRRS